MLTSEERARITALLDERFRANNADISCPMCAHRQFNLIDAYLRNVLQENLEETSLAVSPRR